LSLTLEPKAQLILEEVLPKSALINNFKLKNLHFFLQSIGVDGFFYTVKLIKE
jgi:hypothetical protein